MKKNLILKVNPIGDAIMTLAVAKAILKWGIIQVKIMTTDTVFDLFGRDEGVGLITGLDATSAEGEEETIIIDVCKYLEEDPHRTSFHGPRYNDSRQKDRKGFAHHVARIARHIQMEMAENGLSATDIRVGPDDVKLDVFDADRSAVKSLLTEQYPGWEEKPLVYFVPEAGSPNRVIPPQLINQVAKNVSGDALCLIKDDFLPKGLKGYCDVAKPFHVNIGLLPALFSLCKVVVAPDTGPYHIAEAVSNAGWPVRTILLCGSSHPGALIYKKTVTVGPCTGSCLVAPCGLHGYTEVPRLMEGRPLYPVGKTGCVYSSYGNLAPCMEAVQPEPIQRIIRQLIA